MPAYAPAPGVPFYFYDIPSMTGVRFSMPDFLDVAVTRIPTLAGLKFSNPDLMSFQRCLHSQGGRFDVPFGMDEFLLAALAVGGIGGVGSSYNFAAPIYRRMIAAFNKDKPYNQFIAEQVAGSTPLLHTSLAVKPVSSAEEFAAKIAEMKAPKETVLAVCLDLPVSTAKGAALNVGKLMGKVFLLLDQAEVAAELKAKLPSLIGKARSLVKDEQGNSVCRVSLFFDHSVDVLQHLSIFQNFLLDVTVNRAAPRTDRPGAETGSSQELSEAAKKAEADAASAGAAAPDVDFEQDAIVIPAPKANGVVKDQEMSIISPKAISMFADFPARDQVAVSVKVETGVERFIVSNLHSFLADHGYAPKQITPQKAEEEESMPSANAIASILTILSLLNHFESTLRFEDMTEVFDKFQSLSAVSDMFGKVSLQPSDVLNTLLVTAFRRAAPEAKQQLEKQYTEIRTLLRDCFAGLEGTYHLRVLTPEIALQASVQGIAPFPLFPSIDQIHTRILQDEEREAKRAEEMAAFAHLTEFTDKDFAEFLAKVEAPIKEPWEQRYPKDREESKHSHPVCAYSCRNSHSP